MKCLWNLTALALILFTGHSVNGQFTIDTLYIASGGEDAYVASNATTTNYGSADSMLVLYDQGSPNKIYRSFIKADLSGIPTNAIIVNADLHLYSESVNNGADHNVRIGRITTSWTEASVTYATQPSTTSTGVRVLPHSQTSSTGWHVAGIRQLVQYQVTNAQNYGYRAHVQVESGSDHGVVYSTSEHANTSQRPYLVVEWCLPVVDTFYVTAGKDAQVYSGATSTNYGSDTNLRVGWDAGVSSYAHRTFLMTDLSSITPEYFVTRANLHMYAQSVDNSADHPIYLERVTGTTSWTEGGITWANQPGITTSGRISKTHAATSAAGWHVTDIRNLLIWNAFAPPKNYGYRILLQSESGGTDNGINYASSEHDSTHWRPFVTVEYEEPIVISGYVTHCTNGNDNGQIVPFATGGCHNFNYYSWRKLEGNALSAIIEQGIYMEDAVITGLEDGLYLLDVEDHLGGFSNKWFFVGEEGVTTDVEFYITNTTNRLNYTQDTYLEWDKSPNDSDLVGTGSQHFGCWTSTGVDAASLVQYWVDWDPSLEFTSVDHALNSKSGHQQYASSDNDAWVSRITEPWHEYTAMWSNRPDVTTEDRVYIPTTTTNGIESKNDTIDLRDFVEYWQQHPDENFGHQIALNDYTQAATASRNYGSSDHATGHNLMVSFTVKPKTETEWIDSLGVGNITINAPAGELPYTYLISYYDTIADLSEIWLEIKDSIDIDSTFFFEGKSYSRNFTFENMPAEHYVVSVFDNNGVRLVDHEIRLTPAVELVDNHFLNSSGGFLRVNVGKPSGEASIDRAIEKNQDNAFEFTISTIGDIHVGYNYYDNAAAIDDDDFVFSIKLDNTTKHYYVMLSDSVLFEDTVIVNDKFRLGKENTEFVVYKNNIEYQREQVIPADNLKTGISFASSTGVLINVVQVGKPKKIKPIQTAVYNTECDADNGSISIGAKLGIYPGVTGGTYVVTDLNTMTTEASGSFGVTSLLSVPLPVGQYAVTYTTTGSPIMTWTEYFTIGQPIEWIITNENFYSQLGTVNTISTVFNGEIGTALSQNTLQENVEGWVSFNVGFKYKMPPPGPPVSPILFANVKMVDESLNQKLRVRVAGVGIGGLNKYVLVYDDNDDPTGTPQFLPATNGPFEISLESGDFEVTYNNGLTPFATVAEGTASDYKVYAEAISGFIHDSYASFCYGLTRSDICAHLDYELDGHYYVTNSGRFCFVYNEEYNDENIKLNLYNNNQLLVATQNDFNLDDLIHGENRVVLDFTSNGYCLPVGFYILEVINDKGEKFYLRFYNRYGGCGFAYDSHDENGG